MIKGQNIGRAVSILTQTAREEDMDEEFGRAMGAPMDELRPLIERGRARRFRITRRRIKAMTGLKFKEFVNEVERRTSARWVHFNLGGVL